MNIFTYVVQTGIGGCFSISGRVLSTVICRGKIPPKMKSPSENIPFRSLPIKGLQTAPQAKGR